ncbi:SSU ribosomal protein S6p [hydrothermal vent metagenome]|uniref:SSU ribosomal protein S6p n=1 Tax=hydrothermal vent metagenome TaxID=652676 RepID=A0A1W1EHU2_9ZZZZ
MNCYETMFVIQPTLTEEESKAQVQKIMDVITKQGSEIVATKDMGIRRLAYEVKKHKRGHYTVVLFKAKGDTILEIERNLRINEDVIKFLTIRYSNTVELAQFNKMVAQFSPVEEVAKEEASKVETTESVEETVVATENQEA